MTYFSPHFSFEELACPTAKIIVVAHGFIEKLEYLRCQYGRPMAVQSGCRSDERNNWLLLRGYPASPNSLHLINNRKYGTQTCAIDIERPAGPKLHRLISIAAPLGWSVGIAKGFIHLDLRAHYSTLPPTIYDY